MNYILAEISRYSLSLYYNKCSANRAFVPWGTNGSVPLAICSVNGELRIGDAAIQHKKEKPNESFDDLFEVAKTDKSLLGIKSTDFVQAVLKQSIDELCHDVFYSNIFDEASKITMILSFANDVNESEAELASSGMCDIGFNKVLSVSQSALSIKFFLDNPKYNWSMEDNGMVVMSDNKNLSIKCFNLADGKLIYEKIYSQCGRDPRFDWAVGQIWGDLSSQTYCTREESIPLVEQVLANFISCNKAELTTIKLPDGEYTVYMTKGMYEKYSPTGETVITSLVDTVVKKAHLDYDTTGIILQGYTSKNKFFHESFSAFDPISDEDEDCSREIRNQLLRDLMDGKQYEFEGRTKTIIVPNPPVIFNQPESPKSPVITEPPIHEVSDNRVFNMSYSIKTEGRLRRKRFLTINIEILENKSLPFDCVFTIDSQNFKTYKPDESFCVELEKGTDGKMELGPYELPIVGFDDAKTLYAHIWPANKKQNPNVFKKNNLTINL